MRVVIDALGATRYAGGMTLHAREILSTWAREHPEDEVTVVAGTALIEHLDAAPPMRILRWPNESILSRAPGQLLLSPLLRVVRRADAVLSLSPIVSPLVPRARAYCFQHDWRHVLNPEEFSRLNILYRKLWEVSARHAACNFCISRKAAEETERIVPGAVTEVVENGRDHARRWGADDAQPAAPRTVVTFGHHNNKRPELVIGALARLPQRETLRLVVLGARGDYAERLRALAAAEGVAEQVTLPGFVAEEEYHRLVSTASVVVMASSDEGFGLPAAEAEYFGIPVVVTEDSGMQTIFAEAITAQPQAQSLARALGEALDRGRREPGHPARTWAGVVESVRSAILEGSGRA